MLYFITPLLTFFPLETSNNSYTIVFEFRIANVNIPENSMNETYNTIQNTMNSLVSRNSSGYKMTFYF